MSRPRADDAAIPGSAMKFARTIARVLLLTGLPGGFVAHVARADVVRHPIPNSTFPIAQAVEVSGNVKTMYVSGQVPPVVNKDADPNSREAYGDTRTQTVRALNRIKA